MEPVTKEEIRMAITTAIRFLGTGILPDDKGHVERLLATAIVRMSKAESCQIQLRRAVSLASDIMPPQIDLICAIGHAATLALRFEAEAQP